MAMVVLMAGARAAASEFLALRPAPGGDHINGAAFVSDVPARPSPDLLLAGSETETVRASGLCEMSL